MKISVQYEFELEQEKTSIQRIGAGKNKHTAN